MERLRVLDDSTSEDVDIPTLLNEQCSKYMAMGMTYDEYWYDEPSKAKFYREAFKERARHQNTMMYLQSTYMYEVLCDVAPLYDSLSKNRKPQKFREEPYALFSEDLEKQEERRRINAMEQSKARVQAWINAYQKQVDEVDAEQKVEE